MKFEQVESTVVEEVIKNSPEGKNTKFLNAAHSLWTRFHNYGKCNPFALYDGDVVVSLIFATFNRDGYVNLYEIVTVEGKEGNGYASKCWDEFIKYACSRKMTRLKISCTPTSVSWHIKNGLIFWAVDPSGSLRSDQPLFPTREEQLDFQKNAINDPSVANLPEKSKKQFINEGVESHGFGKKKLEKVNQAIETVGAAWLRDALFNEGSYSLTELFA